ncbi:hypothetical protein [Nitratifractor sp.]
MTYRQWMEEFGERHRRIVESLEGCSEEEIVAYFDYENMRRKHPEFCPLYEKGQKCHDLEDLNCYLCACPHFRFCDEGLEREEEKILYSRCAIEARQGHRFETDEAIHQDCSGCPLPHLSGFIHLHFDRDWGRIMAGCDACPPPTSPAQQRK